MFKIELNFHLILLSISMLPLRVYLRDKQLEWNMSSKEKRKGSESKKVSDDDCQDIESLFREGQIAKDKM